MSEGKQVMDVNLRKRLFYVFVSIFGLASSAAVADDLEVYISPPTDPVSANVLFLIDTSSSLGGYITTSDGKLLVRLEILKQAMAVVLNDPANADVNLGIMGFSSTENPDDPPTRILHPFGPIGSNKATMMDSISALDPGGQTLMAHGIAAAVKWYADGYMNTPSPLDGLQPEGNWCKPNHIVLLFDGKAGPFYYGASPVAYTSSLGTDFDSLPKIQNYTDNTIAASLEALGYIDISSRQKLLSGLPAQLLDPTKVITGNYKGRPCSHETLDFNGPPVNDLNDGVPANLWGLLEYDLDELIDNGKLVFGSFPGEEVPGGLCVKEMLEWAHDADLKTGGEWDWDANDPVQNQASKRKQNIVLDAVFSGNGAKYKYLYDYNLYLAQTGGGHRYPGGDPDALAGAFQSIIDDARAEVSYTYSTPTVPFDQNNVAVSGDSIYVPMFEPGVHSLWYGNLKKYKIAYQTVGGGSEKQLVILDSSGNSAMNGSLFKDSAADEWNHSATDPGLPLNGGAASNMFPGNNAGRNLYTSLDEASGSAILVEDNRIDKTNDNLDVTRLGDLANNPGLNELGGGFDERKQKLLDWLTWSQDLLLDDGNSGQVTVSHRNEMGAVLHSRPVVVRHNGAEVVFVATNEGILHAIDAATGKEKWAYMPAALLPSIADSFISDWNAAKPHALNGAPLPTSDHGHQLLPRYALDGPLVSYEHNGKRYLVMGMRRGGRDYYALDITDLSEPKFAWKITGGQGDFADLGQTWSMPVYVNLQLNGADQKTGVLVFGGGYDPQQDQTYNDSNGNGKFDPGEEVTRMDDTMGNLIYFVDPSSGTLVSDGSFHGTIRSANLVHGEMKNSIPSDVLPVDINSNGVTDRIYAADVGGRIIRIDIPDARIKKLTGNGDITATVIADVNVNYDSSGGSYSDQNGSNYQRFFNTPEVAYYNRGGIQYLAILIASGQRSAPLSWIVDHDRFYMIKDLAVWRAPNDDDGDGKPDYPRMWGENDLYDATANLIQDGSAAQKTQAASDLLAHEGGWYVNFSNGEKGFSAAKVYDYAVLFTTYRGQRPQSNDPCDALNTISESWFYALNMANGSAMFSSLGGNDQLLDKSDRRKQLPIPGLPPPPAIVPPKETDGQGNPKLSGKIIALVGLEQVHAWPDRFHPLYWEQEVQDNSQPPVCPAPGP